MFSSAFGGLRCRQQQSLMKPAARTRARGQQWGQESTKALQKMANKWQSMARMINNDKNDPLNPKFVKGSRRRLMDVAHLVVPAARSCRAASLKETNRYSGLSCYIVRLECASDAYMHGDLTYDDFLILILALAVVCGCGRYGTPTTIADETLASARGQQLGPENR